MFIIVSFKSISFFSSKLLELLKLDRLPFKRLNVEITKETNGVLAQLEVSIDLCNLSVPLEYNFVPHFQPFQ